MSLLDKTADKAQLIDILKSMKYPIIGAGGGYAPLGMYGWSPDYVDSAPEGWLICDGSVYNIADYPEYAALLASQHGRANIYGGDGITTFAVLDLRGEFPRGAGQNSHANQGNGANAGEHQDGTEIMAVSNNPSNYIPTGFYSSSDNKNYRNADATKSESYNIIDYRGNTGGTDSGTYTFTSRPTNTSGTFFVKVTVAGDPNGHHYSTEEQVVGQDENGNTIYEKTIKFDDKNFSSGSDTNVPHGVSNIGESWLNRLIWRDNDGTSRPMIPYCDGNLNNRIVLRSITNTDIVFRTNGDSWSSSNYDYVKVTIRYIKSS